jgi:hypothetical protein
MNDTVKVVHPIVSGNDLGYVIKNREDMLPDDKEFVEKPEKVIKDKAQ